jgi:hypothetical protein
MLESFRCGIDFSVIVLSNIILKEIHERVEAAVEVNLK